MNSNLPALLVPATNAPAGATNDIRPFKPPVVVPMEWAWLWWLLGTLLLVAGLTILGIWLWRRWRKNQIQRQQIPVIPPHELARQRLREARELIEQPRPFCTAVSDAIRQYLEARFEFHAPERTTEEFLVELQASSVLAPDQKQSLEEFLNCCDLVKFAKYEPVRIELEALYDSAVRLIDETQPPPPALEPLRPASQGTP